MNCPKCGVYLSFKNRRCDSCHTDLTKYRQLWSKSNRFYNDGLRKAQVRDLSGAVVSLKQSLQIDKRNTNARNLLGLIYYEMGETVRALSEWVISKNFQEADNLADTYMNMLQNNPSKLHHINQTIKKYNYALSQAKTGNYDVAIIQLKKVVSIQPNYIVAQQLLALLYMDKGDNEKAARCLRKAQKIDIANTTTLLYLSKLGLNPSAVKVDKEIAKKNQSGKGLEKAEEPKLFAPEPEIRDGKINKWSFLQLLIGVIIGVLTVFFLVLPTRENAISEKYNREAVQMAEEQTSMASEIQTLENEKEELQNTIASLQKKMKKIKEEAVDEALYDAFCHGIELYLGGDKEGAAQKLIAVDIYAFESEHAKLLYEIVKEELFPDMSKKKYAEGNAAYNNGLYDDALKLLELSLKYDENNVDAMYFLGRIYQRDGENKKAKKYYNKIINNYPDSSRVGEATRRLDEIQELE